jgi:predicted cupin superfamily sugar epimerase
VPSREPISPHCQDFEINSVNETPASGLQARAVIDQLDLKPHPEGGSYRELYRSSACVHTARGDRSAITAIYYLLERDQISRWHVVEADEIWHFYEGSPLELLAYDPGARALVRYVLGDTKDDHGRLAVIRKGFWQAARSLGDFSLVGCSVGPGFDFEDFRLVASLSQRRAHFAGELAPFASLL